MTEKTLRVKMPALSTVSIEGFCRLTARNRFSYVFKASMKGICVDLRITRPSNERESVCQFPLRLPALVHMFSGS